MKLSWRWLRRPVVVVAVSFLVALFFAIAVTSNREWLLLNSVKIPFIGPFGPYKESILDSFVASLWEDIVFFGLVGAATLLAFASDPRKHDIAAKIWYMFSGEKRTPQALDFNERQVRKLGAFAAFCRVKIHIESYNSELDAFKINVSYESNICNLFENDHFDDELKVSFLPDKLTPADGILGAITTLKIGRYEHGGLKWEELLGNGAITLSEYKREHWESFPFSIHPNSSIEYLYSFWQWSKLGEPFFVGTLRFCGVLEVFLSSSCPKAERIPYEVDYREKVSGTSWQEGPDHGGIDGTERIILGPFNNLEPGQRLIFKFARPQPSPEARQDPSPPPS